MRTIDTEKLRSDATSLSEYISDLNSGVNNLNTTITDNQDSFQGERSTNFFSTLTDDYITDLKSLVSDLESYQEYLSNIPKAYEMLDEEFANKEIDV